MSVQDAIARAAALFNRGVAHSDQGDLAGAARHWLAVAEAVVDGQADAVPFATIALNHLGRLQESRRQYAAAESALAHSSPASR